KITNDHIKVIRESKVILGNIVDRQYFQNFEIKRLIAPIFQASDLEGDLKIMKLFASGRYTV
ncbi:MAG: hypothetical protein EXX96DRAFT_493100, partial [Benjaminiella poitrasii]